MQIDASIFLEKLLQNSNLVFSSSILLIVDYQVVCYQKLYTYYLPTYFQYMFFSQIGRPSQKDFNMPVVRLFEIHSIMFNLGLDDQVSLVYTQILQLAQPQNNFSGLRHVVIRCQDGGWNPIFQIFCLVEHCMSRDLNRSNQSGYCQITLLHSTIV